MIFTITSQNGGVHKLSAAATIVKRFQGMAGMISNFHQYGQFSGMLEYPIDFLESTIMEHVISTLIAMLPAASLRIGIYCSWIMVCTAIAAQKRTHQDDDEDGIELLAREGTLPKSSGCCTTSCYESAEASIFLIRGKHYLQDRKKVIQSSKFVFLLLSWFVGYFWDILHLWVIVTDGRSNLSSHWHIWFGLNDTGGGQRPGNAICCGRLVEVQQERGSSCLSAL